MNRFQLAPLVPYEEIVGQIPAECLVSASGQSVYVRDEGSGPAIVFLHGFASSSRSFRHLFDDMTNEFRLLAFDLNGFGNTERPEDREAYRLEYQADLIAQILENNRIRKAVIVGHSYGAAVAAMINRRHASLVTKTILISPPANIGQKPPWYLRNRIAAETFYWISRGLLSDPERFKKISAKAVYVEGVLTPELSEIYRKSMLVDGFRNAFFGFLNAFSSGILTKALYESIKTPALIIAGANDAIVPLDACEPIADCIPSAHLEIIEACGHCAPEERPQEVIDLIRSFLTNADTSHQEAS